MREHLKDLYNPTIDGRTYTGLYNATLEYMQVTMSFGDFIAASILDGYMHTMYSLHRLRDIVASDDTTDADRLRMIYYALAAHESDLLIYAQAGSKDYSAIPITEITTDVYGATELTKSKGALNRTLTYASHNIEHELGAVTVEVTNAPRSNTMQDYTSPYDTTAYAERGKQVQTTEEFTDATATTAHTNTDKYGAHTDKDELAATTDKDTGKEHTDRHTRQTVLQISARDYYDLQKLIFSDNMYEEVIKTILHATCVCI